jgi:hypothetical protein
MKFTGGTRAGGGIGFDYAELAGSSRRPGARFSRVYERNGYPWFSTQDQWSGQGFQPWHPIATNPLGGAVDILLMTLQ